MLVWAQPSKGYKKTQKHYAYEQCKKKNKIRRKRTTGREPGVGRVRIGRGLLRDVQRYFPFAGWNPCQPRTPGSCTNPGALSNRGTSCDRVKQAKLSQDGIHPVIARPLAELFGVSQTALQCTHQGGKSTWRMRNCDSSDAQGWTWTTAGKLQTGESRTSHMPVHGEHHQKVDMRATSESQYYFSITARIHSTKALR